MQFPCLSVLWLTCSRIPLLTLSPGYFSKICGFNHIVDIFPLLSLYGWSQVDHFKQLGVCYGRYLGVHYSYISICLQNTRALKATKPSFWFHWVFNIAVHTLTRNKTVKTRIFKFCCHCWPRSLQPIIPAEKGRETWISDWHCCYLCYWWSFCSHLDYDISVPNFTHSWDYPLKAKRVLMAGHHSVYFYPSKICLFLWFWL